MIQASDHRDTDLEVLLRAQLLFWMLAATEGLSLDRCMSQIAPIAPPASQSACLGA